uniref:Uncharacterized protein n=1 Tax=Sphaerodactylus townsendi TaxID=933632 RepID=A0ACB8EMY3_9SAUR
MPTNRLAEEEEPGAENAGGGKRRPQTSISRSSSALTPEGAGGLLMESARSSSLVHPSPELMALQDMPNYPRAIRHNLQTRGPGAMLEWTTSDCEQGTKRHTEGTHKGKRDARAAILSTCSFPPCNIPEAAITHPIALMPTFISIWFPTKPPCLQSKMVQPNNGAGQAAQQFLPEGSLGSPPGAVRRPPGSKVSPVVDAGNAATLRPPFPLMPPPFILHPPTRSLMESMNSGRVNDAMRRM